jgi:taurine dioxygenase
MSDETNSLVVALATPSRTRTLGTFGLEVAFDMSCPLDDDDQAAFREVFYREGLLLFRNQRLAMNDQRRVVEYLGPVLAGSGEGYLSPEDEVLGTVALDYHSDLCATPMPLDVISLHALDVVEGTSHTRFASGLRAYREIPSDLRARIDAVDVNMVQTLADKSRLDYEVPPDAMNLVRPCVMHHRITGKPLIFANESSAARIEGLPRDESDALIAAVLAHLYDPSNELVHNWRNGDFIIWDNLSVQHARPSLDPSIPRKMQRVTSGRKTLREQVPHYNLSKVFGEPESDG